MQRIYLQRVLSTESLTQNCRSIVWEKISKTRTNLNNLTFPSHYSFSTERHYLCAYKENFHRMLIRLKLYSPSHFYREDSQKQFFLRFAKVFSRKVKFAIIAKKSVSFRERFFKRNNVFFFIRKKRSQLVHENTRNLFPKLTP